MLTFSVGETRMAVSAALVQEIAPLPRIARVPHAPDALLGVANMRGTAVPVISLATLLNLGDAATHRIVVVDADGPVGLAVTSVSQVVGEAEAASLHQIDVAALMGKAMMQRRTRRSGGGAIAAPTGEHDAEDDTLPLVTFIAGGQDFALPLSAIEEVLRLPASIALLPHADTVVVGSMTAQGAVLPLLSLAALLSLPVAAFTGRSRVVVVRIGAHRVGIVVDAIRSIERVAESAIDPVPQALHRNGAEARIQAICRMEGGTRLLSVLAPDMLLRDDITAKLLQGDLKEQHVMADDAMDAQSERFLLFRIGEEHFGLPIGAVEEVAALPSRLTPLPKAPDFVQGVMHARGKMIPVIDQGQRFNGIPTTSAKPRVVVVQIGTLTAGFIVDAVSEVVNLPASVLSDAPDLGVQGDTATGRLFERVAEVDGRDRLVLIVNPRELLDRAEQDLLARLGRKGAAKPA
ncbi:chemotaxis protein CheW [Sphingobium sufflavum]|uniref:chemotaxis protein CheW n=1 Tax=Sphingobium sufflavum TaxID=1129547 RepID=UPI001F2EED71|nr:chemotaxis protein CheW [Sphingobium sufflavum]MCE7798165.1 chemotaxis protein CheW [Sphingobium sufflavum]